MTDSPAQKGPLTMFAAMRAELRVLRKWPVAWTSTTVRSGK